MKNNIIPIDIVNSTKDNMLEYYLSVIFDRAIADIDDGLKPVQRAIIIAMYKSGFFSNKPHVKCAKVTGQVIADIHPHGK